MDIWNYFTDFSQSRNRATASVNGLYITIYGTDLKNMSTFEMDIHIHVDRGIHNNINYPSNKDVASKYKLDFLDKYRQYISSSDPLSYRDITIDDIKKLIQYLSGDQTIAIEASSNGGVCSKCGTYDQYACPSAKHNNEIRCYLHC